MRISEEDEPSYIYDGFKVGIWVMALNWYYAEGIEFLLHGSKEIIYL